MSDGVKTDMTLVRQRKRAMVDREITFHLEAYRRSGAELIMGTGRFVAPRDDRGRIEREAARAFSRASGSC